MPILISPFFILPAIDAIVIKPLEHCLSTDIPGTDVGNPALIADCLAIFPPVLPCCKAAPMCTSSISSPSILARVIACLIACPINSWGCVSLNAPR